MISDEAWAVLGPLFPAVKAAGRPPVDRRTVVEATAWRFRTGAPWRDLPEQFGNWNTQQAQAVARARHAIRQDRPQPPLRSVPRRHTPLGPGL
ncbi:transposase [Streptomyces sioyaensis]|uniref:transposase n=1 Tax=Streptomyces sioyaensis TaxID=67364 RepID=UPI0033E6833B